MEKSKTSDAIKAKTIKRAQQLCNGWREFGRKTCTIDRDIEGLEDDESALIFAAEITARFGALAQLSAEIMDKCVKQGVWGTIDEAVTHFAKLTAGYLEALYELDASDEDDED